MDGANPQTMIETRQYPLLFEMLRSFTVLASTLNLSHAVRELGSTRQTVRRHISQLEDAIGHPLFEVRDRSYSLTPEGTEVISAAEGILARGHLLLNGGLKNIDGMPKLSVSSAQGWEFHQQQMPLGNIWSGESEFLKATLKAWTASEGHLDAPEMEIVRPYLLVYRDSPLDWICVEIGEKSFYSQWWGWKNARSSIGRPLNKFPGGPEIAAMIDAPYREVFKTQSTRLDQVMTKIPRKPDGLPVANVFNRLLLGSRFPDGSLALIVAVDKPAVIEIEGVDERILAEMPSDVEVNYSDC